MGACVKGARLPLVYLKCPLCTPPGEGENMKSPKPYTTSGIHRYIATLSRPGLLRFTLNCDGCVRSFVVLCALLMVTFYTRRVGDRWVRRGSIFIYSFGAAVLFRARLPGPGQSRWPVVWFVCDMHIFLRVTSWTRSVFLFSKKFCEYLLYVWSAIFCSFSKFKLGCVKLT